MRREDGREVFYCILLDITETKKAQEDLRLSLERHQIIMDQTNDIIFEWQVKQDTLTFSPNGKRNSAMSRCGKMFMRACWTTRIWHPVTTYHCRGASCRIFWKENPIRRRNFAFRSGTGVIWWRRVRATLQKDRAGEPAKAVGVVSGTSTRKSGRPSACGSVQSAETFDGAV